MPKLLVHIGRRKTGTSAFQGFLWDNRDKLAESGIGYPDFVKARNHIEVPALVRVNARHSLRRNIHSETDRDELRKVIRADLERLGAIDENKVTIISAEDLGNTPSVEHVREFLRVAEGTHDDIQVIVYARRPDHLAWSTYCQDIRVGGLSEPFDADCITKRPLIYDHRIPIRYWQECFGQEKVTVLPFLERYKYDSFTVTEQIFDEVGITRDVYKNWDREAADGSVNTSMGMLATQHMVHLNPEAPVFLSNGVEDRKRRNLLIRTVRDLYPGGDVVTPPEVINALNVIAPTEQIAKELGTNEGPKASLWQEWLDQPGVRVGEIVPLSSEEIAQAYTQVFQPTGPVRPGKNPPKTNKLRRTLGKVRRKVTGRN